MDKQLFEQLLYEDEGPTLDFKRDQYPFAKATEEQKSELLKDILGFANAWRRSEAYILIGVEDVRGGRGNVVGIPQSEHLDDHSLQQFVNSLTNQPVRFRYQAFGFEERQVGIITIDQQTRPLYLKRGYGKLRKEEVYVRRGSSTDPTKPASLEEIAQMRLWSPSHAPELSVAFADVDSDDVLGRDISWSAEFCEMPPMESIPDLSPPRRYSPFGIDTSPIASAETNSGFYRALSNFEFARRWYRPICLVVSNVGQVVANNVRIETTIPADMETAVHETHKMPRRPKRHHDPFSVPGLEGPMPTLHRSPGSIHIDKNEARFRVEIEYGTLQPGRRVQSDAFCIARRVSGKIHLSGTAFADNLPQPKQITLTIDVQVEDTVMTVDELCSLPAPTPPDE